MKTCKDCQTEKSREEFYSNPNGRGGLFAYCKACHLVRGQKARDRRLLEGAREPRAEKFCHLCRLTLPGSAFSLNRVDASGLQPYCKTCAEGYRRVRTYGLSARQVEDMMEAQGGLCAACGTPGAGLGRRKNQLVVDHCHLTGRVRALICNPCNMAEGLLQTPEKAEALARYMLRTAS